jgi:adenine-specific DNA-methyltransferase
MKYMGSKRAMLLNGLGNLINQAVDGRSRFVDLFAGSGAVAKFVASAHDIPVLASDLQEYAVFLTGAVIHRTKPIQTSQQWVDWLSRAEEYLACEPELFTFAEAFSQDCDRGLSREKCLSMIHLIRELCPELSSAFPITRAYGGHYFGLSQSLWIDALRATVPSGDSREVAIAALIEAASECSASPGHTAQPFSPTETGLPHVLSAWNRNLVLKTSKYFSLIAQSHARKLGVAYVADAVKQTAILSDRDLVFLDPPYSEVQYSRFYHVLEGIAVGEVGEVSGVGRYPPLGYRPQSNFSRRQPAVKEFDRLMIGVASVGAHALVTFPEADASNGLSGILVEEIAGQYFRVVRRVVKSTFSTLGGNGKTRGARHGTTELILHLLPR